MIETASSIEPGSVDFTMIKSVKRTVKDGAGQVLSTNYIDQSHWVTDNGNGSLVSRRDFEVIGTVNYSTGQLVIAGNTFLKQVNA